MPLSIGLDLSLTGVAASSNANTGPQPDSGFVLLTDDDGAFLTDDDGTYLQEAQ